MANSKFKIQNSPPMAGSLSPASRPRRPEAKKLKKLWIGIAILIILSPVGLILPELLKAGGAWGEWGADEIEKIAGYVPHGLKKLSELWKAPIPDYAFSGWDKGVKSYIGYIFSGIIGAALVIGISMLIGKIFAGGNGNS